MGPLSERFDQSLSITLPADVLLILLQYLKSAEWNAILVICRSWCGIILTFLQQFSFSAIYSYLPSPPRLIPESVDIEMLLTRLYPYQLQALEQMLRKEDNSESLDPSLECPPSARAEGVRGGILGEEMGTGKTVLFLALLCKTKGQQSVIPGTYRTLLCEHSTPPRPYYEAGLDRTDRESAMQPATDYRVYSSKCTLVVVPKILINQWIEEINKHTHPHALAVKVCYTDQELRHLGLSEVLDCDVLMIGLCSLRMEHQRQNTWTPMGMRKEHEAIQISILSRIRFRRVVVDEGHTLGRGMTSQNKFLHNLHSDIRWVCSGTPFPGTSLPRQLDHLHSIIHFLQVEPYHYDAHAWQVDIRRPLLLRQAEGIANLVALLSRVMIRTQIDEVYQDLCIPDPVVREVRLEFRSAAEVANYNKIVTLMRTNLVASQGVDLDSLLHPNNSKQCLALINNLGYVCTTAVEFEGYQLSREVCLAEIVRLLDTRTTSDGLPLTSADLTELRGLQSFLETTPIDKPLNPSSAQQPSQFVSSKIRYLIRRLQKLIPHHKCIVFTRDNDALIRIASAIDQGGLVGVTVEVHRMVPLAVRSAAITAFNHDDAIRIILMNTYLASEGISLTAASYIFLMEPLLDKHIEDQAIARAHRIGQHKTVQVEKLIMRHTSEDFLSELLTDPARHSLTSLKGASLARALIRLIRPLHPPQPLPSSLPKLGTKSVAGDSSDENFCPTKRSELNLLPKPRRSAVYGQQPSRDTGGSSPVARPQRRTSNPNYRDASSSEESAASRRSPHETTQPPPHSDHSALSDTRLALAAPPAKRTCIRPPNRSSQSSSDLNPQPDYATSIVQTLSDTGNCSSTTHRPTSPAVTGLGPDQAAIALAISQQLTPIQARPRRRARHASRLMASLPANDNTGPSSSPPPTSKRIRRSSPVPAGRTAALDLDQAAIALAISQQLTPIQARPRRRARPVTYNEQELQKASAANPACRPPPLNSTLIRLP
eukprot:NODE_67_length_3531_cov_19.824912_g62_i0.p1 GENE.NODE_67_length_3531_cov_19.824912_g62_i0~~NODE_67_length_3531_cov_19.824912_g62_i0.p1  ORF type:complete len:994 (-),score=207.84 NODE_67_length_3531_cov_19.824912_g62_i0:538-3519(-)